MTYSKVKKSVLAALIMFLVLSGALVLYVLWFVNLPKYHVLHTDERLIVDFQPGGLVSVIAIANYDFHTTVPEFDLLTSEIAEKCRPVNRVPTDIVVRTRIIHPPSDLDLALGYDYGPELVGWDEDKLDGSGQPTPIYSDKYFENLVVLNRRVCQSTHDLMSRLKRAIKSEINRQNVARDGARIETVVAFVAEHCWTNFDDCRRGLLRNLVSGDSK